MANALTPVDALEALTFICIRTTPSDSRVVNFCLNLLAFMSVGHALGVPSLPLHLSFCPNFVQYSKSTRAKCHAQGPCHVSQMTSFYSTLDNVGHASPGWNSSLRADGLRGPWRSHRVAPLVWTLDCMRCS